MADRGGAVRGRFDEGFVDGLHLGDAIRFFLDAKRAGGRSERTISEYRKKLDLFQRWAAKRLEGEGAVDAPAERAISKATVASSRTFLLNFLDPISKIH